MARSMKSARVPGIPARRSGPKLTGVYGFFEIARHLKRRQPIGAAEASVGTTGILYKQLEGLRRRRPEKPKKVVVSWVKG